MLAIYQLFSNYSFLTRAISCYMRTMGVHRAPCTTRWPLKLQVHCQYLRSDLTEKGETARSSQWHWQVVAPQWQPVACPWLLRKGMKSTWFTPSLLSNYWYFHNIDKFTNFQAMRLKGKSFGYWYLISGWCPMFINDSVWLGVINQL